MTGAFSTDFAIVRLLSTDYTKMVLTAISSDLANLTGLLSGRTVMIAFDLALTE